MKIAERILQKFKFDEYNRSAIFFFNFLKGFYRMKICLKIITAKPVIVQTWSGAHSLRCQTFWRCNFFSISLGGLLEKKFLDNRDCLTHNSTDSL